MMQMSDQTEPGRPLPIDRRVRNTWAGVVAAISKIPNHVKTTELYVALNDHEGAVRAVEAAIGKSSPPSMKICRLDDKIRDFVRALPWAEHVPPADVDLAVQLTGEVHKPMLRFVLTAGSPADAPADFSSFGDAPWEMISALGLLAEQWTKRHGADPGEYPDGIKAAIVTRLDLRTAASWIYSAKIAAFL